MCIYLLMYHLSGCIYARGRWRVSEAKLRVVSLSSAIFLWVHICSCVWSVPRAWILCVGVACLAVDPGTSGAILAASAPKMLCCLRPHAHNVLDAQVLSGHRDAAGSLLGRRHAI